MNLDIKLLFSNEYKMGSKSIDSSDQVGTSLVVQWLRLRPFTAEGLGSIPGPGTKTPHAAWCGQKKKKKKKSNNHVF